MSDLITHRPPLIIGTHASGADASTSGNEPPPSPGPRFPSEGNRAKVPRETMSVSPGEPAKPGSLRHAARKHLAEGAQKAGPKSK
jgi:hypothetical protein